jgi:hypothetical protein
MTKEYIAEVILEKLNNLLYEKKDRCYRSAKRKFKKFPSAHAGAYIGKCRKGKIKIGKRKNK